MGPSSDICPDTSNCKIHPADQYAVCCKKCRKGTPMTDSSGNQIFCGDGPSHQDCPTGYTCTVEPADAFAVCCAL